MQGQVRAIGQAGAEWWQFGVGGEPVVESLERVMVVEFSDTPAEAVRVEGRREKDGKKAALGVQIRRPFNGCDESWGF